MPRAQPLPRDARVYIAGHRGLVGSALWRRFEADGFTDLVGQTSTELDLRDRPATFAFLDETRPHVVVLAAAKVGGILANATQPVEFLSDNVRIQANVLDGAHRAGVERLLFLGSSCIYPKFAPQPIREDSLLTGPLEPTQPGLRDREDRRCAPGAGLPHAVRAPVDLGHADEPLRPG